jgi:hypothetical protein
MYISTSDQKRTQKKSNPASGDNKIVGLEIIFSLRQSFDSSYTVLRKNIIAKEYIYVLKFRLLILGLQMFVSDEGLRNIKIREESIWLSSHPL